MSDEKPKARRGWWQRFKLSSAHTQANIVCTIIIMIATVGYAILARFQLKAMSGQLDQMRGASSQTNDLICLYRLQLAQLTKQSDSTARLAVSASDQAAAAKTSAETAQSSLQATIDNFHREQRAWVGVIDSSVSFSQCDTARPTNSCKVTVQIHNVGKTPALRLRRASGFALSSPFLDPMPRTDYVRLIEGKLKESKSNRDLAPGDTLTLEAIDSGSYVASHWSKILSGVDFLYIYGRFEYSDVYKGLHSTVFCFYVKDPKDKQTASCDGYNSMN